MAKPLIVCRDLSIIYNKGKSNEFKALQGVNTDIFEGEYIILFGPSGCGKSTLMYSIQGSLPPGEGTLLIKGDDIYSYPPSERVYFQRYVMGIIFQSFNLIGSLSVLDNVCTADDFCNVDKTTRNRRAQSLLDRFGVGHVAHKIPAMLSGGQQQRVSVARSMVNDPKILLADEPTGNLDSVSTQQVMDKIDEINTFDRRTIIMGVAQRGTPFICSRVYYLKDGFIVREVVNPQRKQIKPVREGETIVTELEQLARLFPYDSVDTLRTKSMVNYLTQDYSFDQIVRMEHAVSLFIRGRLDRESFIKSLVLTYERGGVEVSEAEAKRMASVTERMMNHADDIRRFRGRKDNANIFFNQHKLAERMRDHLIGLFRIKLSKEQDTNLVEVIADRVTGVIDAEEMNQRMMAAVSKSGLGLSVKEADEMCRYFEKVVAQGVDVNYKA